MLRDSQAAPGHPLPPRPSASLGSPTPPSQHQAAPCAAARESLPSTLNKEPLTWMVFVCFLSC